MSWQLGVHSCVLVMEFHHAFGCLIIPGLIGFGAGKRRNTLGAYLDRPGWIKGVFRTHEMDGTATGGNKSRRYHFGARVTDFEHYLLSVLVIASVCLKKN